MATGARLIGRDDELAALGDAVARARGGRRTAVVLEGEAGIGKSRLLTEALASLRWAKDAVGVGHGVELFDGQVPYATIADTLRTLARDTGEAELHRAAGQYGPTLAPLVPLLDPGREARTDVDRMRLLPAYVSTVEALASDRLVWIVLEDLHWADTSSLDVMGYLVRVTDAAQLVIIASIRTNDPATEHSRVAFVDSLVSLDGVDRLHLDALRPDETAALVADLTGRPSDDADVVRLSALGHGNPLLTEQLVSALHSGQPTDLEHAMHSRIRNLDPEALRLVQLAALGDGHLQHHLLKQIYVERLGSGSWETAQHEALDTGLLTYDAAARAFTFSHALLRQAAEDTLSPAELLDGHRRWAECLAALVEQQADHGPDPRLLVAVAGHWAHTEHDANAFAAAIEAAEVCNRLGASDTAVTLLLRAWTLWDHVPAARQLTTLDRDDLLREVCAASIAADRISAAIALLDREIERTDRHTDPLRHLHVRLTRAELAERIGAPLDFQLYEEATASVDALREAGPSPLKGPALSALGWYLRWRDPDLSFHLHREAVDLIRLGGPHAHFPYESGLVADHLVQRGDFEGALSSVETALGWANSVYDASSLVSTRSAILQYLGQLPRAVEVAEQSVSMFPDPRLADAMWGYVGLQACQRHLAAGNWNRVAELYDRCAGLDVEDFDVATWLACRRAQFACARGDLDNAEALEELAIARMPDPVAAHLTHRLPVQQTRAEVAAARGRLDEALGHLDPLLDEPALPWFAAMWPAVLAAARIAADRGDPQSEQLSRIREAGERLPQQGPFIAACRLQTEADLARAEHRDDVTTWERVQAAWRDLGHVPHLGWSSLRLATARVQAGDKATASEPLAEAWQIARRLGAAPLEDAVVDLARRAHLTLETGATSSDRTATGLLARLTQRELEVLRHVARGENNDEIAAALFISPRTASVHVSRILTKLDVSNRSKAAAVAYQEGLAGHDSA